LTRSSGSARSPRHRWRERLFTVVVTQRWEALVTSPRESTEFTRPQPPVAPSMSQYISPKRRLGFQQPTRHYIQEDRTSVNRVPVAFLILNRLFNTSHLYLKGYNLSANYTVTVIRRYGNRAKIFIIVSVDRNVWLT
jgi:hypothetical protein